MHTIVNREMFSLVGAQAGKVERYMKCYVYVSSQVYVSSSGKEPRGCVIRDLSPRNFFVQFE